VFSFEETLVEAFNIIGGLVCHQMPERTLQIGGRLLCVCARDTGIYLGLLFGLFLIPMRRRDASGPPNLYITLAMILPMIADGTTQAVGLRNSTNQLRLITGLLFGTATSPFLIYLLPTLPLSRKLPIIRSFIPPELRLDDPRSWLPLRAFALGLGIDLAALWIVGSLAGSNNQLLYWLFSLLILASLVLTILLMPVLLLVSALLYGKERSGIRRRGP